MPLLSLLERLARLVHSESHAAGLRPVQWDILRFLAQANRFSRTPSGLTAYLGQTKGTVSQSLKALEDKGLVEKLPQPGDKRGVDVRLSTAGRAMLAKDPLVGFMDGLDGFGLEDRTALEALLSRYLTGLLTARQGRMFGECRQCRFFQASAAQGPYFCGLLKQALSEEDSRDRCIEFERVS